MIEKEKLQKLPEYVRREIERLQRNLDTAQERLRVMDAGASPIRIWQGAQLPPDATIEFDLGEDVVRCSIGPDGRSLRVAMRERMMRIQPHASNVVDVLPVPFVG